MEDCTSIPQLPDDCHSPLITITITPQMVFDKLTQLSHTKAPGPEGWPLFCFKECTQELSIPLSILFNKSLESSVLPNCWKKALVTPAFKKGDHTQVSNYHPISLTLPICKGNPSLRTTFKNISRPIMLYHRNSVDLLQEDLVQLLLAMNDWTNALDAGHSIDILYFDFAKAFDSVPHNRLISKFRSCGIY